MATMTERLEQILKELTSIKEQLEALYAEKNKAIEDVKSYRLLYYSYCNYLSISSSERSL
jgi:hypothetical protein